MSLPFVATDGSLLAENSGSADEQTSARCDYFGLQLIEDRFPLMSLKVFNDVCQ